MVNSNYYACKTLTLTPKSGEVELQMAPILAAASIASTA